MIPSLNRIEIAVKRDIYVLLGAKGLHSQEECKKHSSCEFEYNMSWNYISFCVLRELSLSDDDQTIFDLNQKNVLY